MECVGGHLGFRHYIWNSPTTYEEIMKNTVELIGTYGDDLTHACSAWTSTSRNLTPRKLARVDKLLDMLAREGEQGTTFFI
jgi:hypothetical protein